MAAEEFEYYEQRAEAEIALAQQAADSRVVQAHYELANFYLDKVYGDDDPAKA